jgi:hypothetical protein
MDDFYGRDSMRIRVLLMGLGTILDLAQAATAMFSHLDIFRRYWCGNSCIDSNERE